MGGGTGLCHLMVIWDHGGRGGSRPRIASSARPSCPFHLHQAGSLDRDGPLAALVVVRMILPPILCRRSLRVHSLESDRHPVAFDQSRRPRFSLRLPVLPLSSRSDVLAFQTAPLQQPSQIRRPDRAELWSKRDAPDTISERPTLIGIFIRPRPIYPRGAMR